VNTFQIVKEQLVHLRGIEMRHVTMDTVISQVVDSRSFLTLLINLEKALQITVSDEDFYESAPVTLGQLADLLAGLANVLPEQNKKEVFQ
jgi:acyl carrier protein